MTRAQHFERIKAEVQSGKYVVNPSLVAEAMLRKAENLDRRSCEVVGLRDMQGLTFRQIGQELGVHLDTARSDYEKRMAA